MSAATLVKRGIGSKDDAARFLDASESYPASDFGGIEQIAESILDAVGSQRKITVYGDYDADGVCATSILVELLRSLGAECDWLIPDRIADGYGLTSDLIEQLAARSTDLIITVDCGVTSVSEAALARSLGMEIVITDHHQFGEELPDCPILHPILSEYPYPHLCGAGVAAKLASMLRQVAGLDSSGDEADLDLVALATVADMMPLDGENRSLVKRGIAVARRGGRIGMRALMASAKVEPVALSAGDFGFRLGPRVNAVGRMYRADAGVELFLTQDPVRAGEIGDELSRANSERRKVERDVENQAEKAFRATHGPDASAIVVAGEGWHQGVVGIVASRLSKNHGLPAVVLSVSGEVAKGSARSVPGLDLHAAIAEVSDLLVTFGGHRAAAGLTVASDRIDLLREELGRSVAASTGGGPVTITPDVDAFVGGGDIDMTGAEQLERLEPFGNGNRPPSLVIPSARIEDLQAMGEGKHCRFSITSGGQRAKGLAFNRNSFPGPDDAPVDLIGELTVNHWRGTSEPRFQVTAASLRPENDVGPLSGPAEAEWWDRFDSAMAGEPSVLEQRVEGELPECVSWSGSAEAALASIISSGSRTLVVTSESYRRWLGLGGSAIERFVPGEGRGGALVGGLWPGSPIEDLREPSDFGDLRVLLVDFETVGLMPGIVGSFEEIVVFDHPSSDEDLARLASDMGRIHRVEDLSSLSFALAAAAERNDPVPALRTVYREASDAGSLTGEGLHSILSGSPEAARSPERAAMLITVLLEAGVVASEGIGPGRSVEVVSSKEVDLHKSALFRRLAKAHEEQVSYIRQSEKRIN